MSNSQKPNTSTKNKGVPITPGGALGNLKPDEIQVVLLLRRAKKLKQEFPSEINSLRIEIKDDPYLVVKTNDNTDIGADEFVRQKDVGDPVVLNSLRLSQVIKRVKSRLNKDVKTKEDVLALSKEERATVTKSNRSFLPQKEKGKKPEASSSQETH